MGESRGNIIVEEFKSIPVRQQTHLGGDYPSSKHGELAIESGNTTGSFIQHLHPSTLIMQRVYPSLPYKLPPAEGPKTRDGLTLLSLPLELLQAVIDEMVSAFGIYQAVKLRLISSNCFL